MSIFPEVGQSSQSEVLHSGTMGFTRLLNLSPAEVGYIRNANVLERLLFSLSHQEVMDVFIQEFIDETDDARLRAVSRLLICPIYSKLMNLRQKLATGLPGLPFEALITSFEDRLLDNRSLLRTTNTYIPAVRAPVVSLI
jgi:DNA helicase INO80